MKHIISILTFSLMLLSNIVFAQKTVKASTIIKQIKEGAPISYKNATIVGVLDFTFMDEALEKMPKKKKSWFNWSSNNNSKTNEIKKMIEVPISFVNCTFKENVLAYIPDENSGYTFTADFEENVFFTQCTFERKAMFKYSRFERGADFSNTIFEEDNTFKYAKFDRDSNFSNTTFNEEATFKYVKFSRNINFTNANFNDSATFKYAKFMNGVSFKGANFEEDLNIKYMKVSGDFNITNMKVAFDIDSKYTKINGKSFSKYLVDKK